MQYLGLFIICILGGWWLFAALLGSDENAKNAFFASPIRGCAGILFMGFIFLLGLMVIGYLFG